MHDTTSTTPKHAKRRNGHRTLATAPKVTDTRIALYCRVSSDEQSERKTIDAQFDFLRNWALLYDFPIAGEYADDGISGTDPLDERPDGVRLLQDAQAGSFGTVAVYRVDRLARSLRVLMDGYTELEAAGVAIKSATEAFDTSTPMGKFVFQLLGSMAELDRSTLIERMNLGRDRVTRHGRWLNGPVPLGYTLDAADGLVPSMRLIEQLGMTEAAMVIDLFTRIAGGSSGTAEAIRLQTVGVPLIRYYANGTVHTTADGQWHPARILKLIKNETYVGLHRYKSRFGTIERPVPPLVTRDIWERANAQVRCNQRLPKPNATRVYLLRGLITCGVCGRAFVGQRMSPLHRRAPWYYRCNGQTASGSPDPTARCRNAAINATEIEDYIWQRCRYMLEHPKETLADVQRYLEERLPQTRSTPEQEQALLRKLAEKQRGEEVLLTALRSGRIKLAAWDKEMASIKQEREVLERELDALRSQKKLMAEVVSYYQSAEGLLTHGREQLALLEATNDREGKRGLIAQLVEAVVVYAENMRVHFYLRKQEECVAVFSNQSILPPTTPSPSGVSRTKTRRRMPRSGSSGRVL